MAEKIGCAIAEHFKDLKDPRVARGQRHYLMDIIVVAICGVICGAEGWEDIEAVGKMYHERLKHFLRLPNGIPSPDTIRRVFARLDPNGLEGCFYRWVQSIRETGEESSGHVERENVGIDGKTLRHSFERGARRNSHGPIHMVSAWANELGMVLGQIKTEEKSNEITAIPKLLDMLELRGCIVSTDAMGCQTAIAKQIVDKDADYIFSLKGNQGDLERSVELGFEIAEAKNFDGISFETHEESGTAHGRRETRKYWVISDLFWLPDAAKWPGLNSVCMVESTRNIKGEESTERRYYISSLKTDAKQIAKSIRKHWGVENSLHWVLDVTFREDECRIRRGNGSENFAVLRHIALNLLKREPSKHSVKRKRFLAALSFDYLLSVLNA